MKGLNYVGVSREFTFLSIHAIYVLHVALAILSKRFIYEQLNIGSIQIPLKSFVSLGKERVVFQGFVCSSR